MNNLLITIGKIVKRTGMFLNIGGGSTWPGHIALTFNPNFIKDLQKKSKMKTIVVVGTNGKTTTSKLIKSILEENGEMVLSNQAGANLLNGVASTYIRASNLSGKIKHTYATFEVDENTVPLLFKQITPDYVVLLNIFRDQLDRYGEVDKVARIWKESLELLPASSTIVINADDPLVSYISEKVKSKKIYFGLNDKNDEAVKPQNAADSIYCLFCGNKLSYKKIFFSHLGDWYCEKCKNKRHNLKSQKDYQNNLKGTYNKYNVLAAILTAKIIGVKNEKIEKALLSFKPAFGRQEEIKIDGKNVQLFLSKNPTSFNESLRTINELSAKSALIVLNDRIPDGKDISWIWDTDIESLAGNIKNITISGDRTYDMALRFMYAGFDEIKVEPDLKQAIRHSLNQTNDKLFILPTYSAMLEVRKILTGRKLL